jgi:serine/threonine-protein kinase
MSAESEVALTLERRVNAACDHFEAAWRAGARPRLEDYLDDGQGPTCPALLAELLALELAYRTAGGEAPRPEEYKARIPEHGALIDEAFRTLDRPTVRLLPIPARVAGPAEAPRRESADTDPGGGVATGPPAVPGYEMGGRLGGGGMGEVWGGRDRLLRRDVAIKVLRAELVGQSHPERRFVEEAQVASQLVHPAIPPVHELSTLPDGRPYFVMKLVRGRTLADLLEARTSPTADLPRLLGVFEQVCQAVAYAHSKGVIHRDLKPSNVMVGAFGEVQLMDWGLAKVRGRTPAAEGVPAKESVVETRRSADADDATQAGSVLGTPAYMAPEQARGEVDALDERADVFGLGAILCEVLTGRPPYAGTAEEVKAQAQAGHLAPARQLLAACGADEELVGLARRCLGARAEERPAGGAAVAAALTAYLAGVQERLRKAELDRAAARARAVEERKRRRISLALAAAVLALVAVGAGGGLLVQRQAATRQAEHDRHEAEQARREGERRQAVGFALEKAAGLRKQERYREAATVLEQARQAVGDAGPDDLRQRLDGADAELALVKRLDAIRQRRASWVEGHFDYQTADNDYAAAFRGAGLGTVGDDAGAVAARVRDSAVAGPLVAALDDWAYVAQESQTRRWLLAVLRLADPHPWRNHFRDLAMWGPDRRPLQALADEAVRDGGAKLDELSPQMLNSVAARLGGKAIPLLRAAQRRHPSDFWLNLQLGGALHDAKQREEALGYTRVAVALRPDIAAARNNLAVALLITDDVDGALAEYQKAVELDPTHAIAHYGLGFVLRAKGDVDGAAAEYRNVIDLAPKHAVAHGALGRALMALGRFTEARAETRQCLGLLPAGDPLRQRYSEQLQRIARRAGLDEKLPAVLRGDAQPPPADRAEMAFLCRTYKKLPLAATLLYAGAFADDPRLADDLEWRHRYSAACSAALAAAGRGGDAGRCPDKAVVTLRRQALGWLRADLALWARIARPDDSRAKRQVRQRLTEWQLEADLVSVRDPAALDRLPDEERAAWCRLWEDVAALRKKVEEVK